MCHISWWNVSPGREAAQYECLRGYLPPYLRSSKDEVAVEQRETGERFGGGL